MLSRSRSEKLILDPVVHGYSFFVVYSYFNYINSALKSKQ